MSKIILKNNKFIQIIDILKDLSEDCVIRFTKDSIIIKTIDKSMVNIIDVTLTDIFIKSTIKKDIIININLEQLNKVFSCKKKEDKTEINFLEDYVKIKYSNDETDEYSTYKIHLLINNFDEDFPNIEIEKNTLFLIDSKYFTQQCKIIQKFDESIIIESKGDDIFLKTGENRNVNICIGKNNMNKIKIKNEIKIMVLLKYLLYFCKCEKIVDKVQIVIQDEETPLEITYKSEDCIIKFYTSSQDI